MQYSEINSWNLFSLKKTEVLTIPTVTGTLTTFCNVLFNDDTSAILQFSSALPPAGSGECHLLRAAYHPIYQFSLIFAVSLPKLI